MQFAACSMCEYDYTTNLSVNRFFHANSIKRSSKSDKTQECGISGDADNVVCLMADG